MFEDLCVLTCANHRAEVAETLRQAELTHVRLETFPSQCGRPGYGWDDLANTLQDCGINPDQSVVLAGGCIRVDTTAPPEMKHCRVVSHPHCSAWFAPTAIVDAHLRDGGYLMTSGWLQDWKAMLQQWGFDQSTAGEFFRECSRRLVVFDTHIHPPEQTQILLDEMSEYLALPNVAVGVGLDYFRAFLMEQLYRWRLDRERRALAEANRRVAEYATTADLVTRLSHATREEEAVELLFDNLQMLCAPRRLAYLPLVDGTPGTLQLRNGGDADHDAITTRMLNLAGDHGWTPSGAGFTVRVPERKHAVAFLEVDHLDLPGRKAEYLDLVQNVITAFGLAVSNARAQQRALRFSSVLSRSLNEIYMFDAKTLRFTDVNHGALENLGYSMTELNLLTPLDLKPDFTAAEFADAIAPLRSGEQELIRFETEHLRKDGTRYPVQVNLELIREEPATFIAVVLDMTARKAADRARAELEEQLRQAQKMEAVGRLAGGIAHDFNNMLTVILGNCELLGGELPPGSPYIEDVEQISEAGRRAKSLTRQLLAYSRRQTLRPEVLDLNELLEGLRRMLRRVIGEDIGLTTVKGSGLWSVKADAGQLNQVLLNLAINARDAMPDGGQLTLETANVELDESYAKTHHGVTPGVYVMLGISDTGEGMDAEIREQIFEPFFTTKGVGEGTGLGLSTVHGIVKQSGGHIWIYSEPGEGTTFKIYLPRAGQELSATYTPKRLDNRALNGSETILIVEDEAAVLNLAVRVLRRHGYTILQAGNGKEAERISLSHEGTIALLLTDVVMPGQSGRVTAQQLLRMRPSMKVIYMSGYTDNAIVHHGVLDPGTNFIEKPFSPASLATAVRAILDGDSAD